MKLTEQQVRYIKHFINQYHQNLEEGKIEDAHHDAMAILLLFEEIFTWEPPK